MCIEPVVTRSKPMKFCVDCSVCRWTHSVMPNLDLKVTQGLLHFLSSFRNEFDHIILNRAMVSLHVKVLLIRLMLARFIVLLANLSATALPAIPPWLIGIHVRCVKVP